MYKLRIDVKSEDDFEQVESFVKRYSPNRYILCYEEADSNNHCHAYLEITKKAESIRSMIRKMFGSGNGAYSLTELDNVENNIQYKAYCIKQNKFVTYGFEQEEIDQIIDYDKKVKESIKERKKKKKTMIEQLKEYIEVNHDSNDVYTKEEIVNRVVEYYKETGVLFRKFLVSDYINTLVLKYVGIAEQTFKQELLHSTIMA